MKSLMILLLLLSFPAVAHDSVAGPTCPLPNQGTAPDSGMEREILMAALVIYEKCMFDYIREQQTLAGVHENAAQSALDTWNETLDRIVQ